MSLCTVTFLPSHKSVGVPAGTYLHDAAQEAGVEVALPCGAQGRCGRCKVKVEKGEVLRRDDGRLTIEQIKEGWTLSCVSKVQGDLVVTVPLKKIKEKAIGETVTEKVAVPIQLDWPHSPSVRRVFLKMSPPTLADNLSDLDRLTRAFSMTFGVEEITLGLPLLRRLPQILRVSQWQVAAVIEEGSPSSPTRIIELLPASANRPLLGIAVDIGTTTIVVYLVEMESGKIIDRASAFNGQIAYGEDVISRIVYSQRGNGLEDLRGAVVKTINDLLQELRERNGFQSTEVYDMVAAGNTTMMHLFLGIYPRHIREEPYTPAAVHLPVPTAGEAGISIHPDASVYCLPGVAAYVGGDITSGVLASGVYKSDPDKLSLFMDVGTNGELVLGNADWMMTCACSAGPAFEGAGVGHGMRATTGAIEDVRINSQTLEPTIKVIDDTPPSGICGSGMISALAEMFITGVVDKAGHIDLHTPSTESSKPSRLRTGDHGPEYVLVWASESGTEEDIVLSEVDINNLIRTKAAIYAGITVMLRSVGISLASIEQVLIGGAFGQHINIEEAIQIGLLPDLPWDRFQYLGNTSVQGAYAALLSREARRMADEIARRLTYLELIADNTFMDEFTSALFLPHTNLDSFPTVKSLLNNGGNE